MNTWKLSEIEKEKAIQRIVRQGIVSPADRIREIVTASKACSFRTLFFGVGDCLFLGMLITLCLWSFLLRFTIKTILCSVFALSPFAYISCFLLTTWKEHLVQLYEVKMSCHFTIRQVIALRMIYLSFGNMLINTAALSLFAQTQAAVLPFWKTLGLSFAALFLYGVFMLFFQIKGRMVLSAAIPAVVWGLFSFFITVCYGNRVETLLLNLTGTLVFLVASCSFAAYLFMLYRFFTTRHQGEVIHVIG